MSATTRQIGLIHGLKKRAALDEDSYRAVLNQVAGVSSSKQLSVGTAIAVIDRLMVLAGDKPAATGTSENGHDTRSGLPAARGALRLEGPYAGKLRALWLTGYALGIVKDKTDSGLAAFVRRQTGIDHPNWLRDAASATRVIEGIKSWICRETGFDWTERASLRETKLRVVHLAWQRALDCGAVHRNFMDGADLATFGGATVRRPNRTVADIAQLTDLELDQVARAIGWKIRKKLDGGAR